MREISKYSGLGRLIIPSNIDRDMYIRKCYDTGRVSVLTYGAGALQNVAVAKHCMNDLEFPLKADGTGCVVAYNKIPKRNEYVIYAVIKEIGDVSDLTEYQFSVGTKTDLGIAKIAGDADDGSMTVTVNHNKKGGTLTINIGNNVSGGTMTIDVSGALNTDSDEFNINAYDKISMTIPKSDTGGLTSIKYIKGKGFTYTDEFGNTQEYNKNNMQISPIGLFNIGTGAEQLILGNTFTQIFNNHTDIMNRVITACSKMIFSTSFGKTVPPDNASDFIQLAKDLAENQQEYETFLSKLSNTD